MSYLTMYERTKIETMLKDGKTPKEIAARLGRHYTTIYKEIAKGTVTFKNPDWTYRKEYCADTAQCITDDRQKNKGRGLKIGHDYGLAARIEYLIGECRYSPYAASVDIRKDSRFTTTLCKGTIYNYIDAGIFLNITNDNLYSKKHKRKKKGSRSSRPSYKNLRAKGIEERPEEAEDRSNAGHWEMDTVYSGKGTSTACILALTERSRRLEHLSYMPDRTLGSTVQALDRIEQAIGLEAFQKRFRTITVDNGSEFADSGLLERSCTCPGISRTQVYYCHPNASYERGSNENHNKLIRHWIPKGADISAYGEEKVKQIEQWINDLPRELFGGMSANEYAACITKG
ncbi:MAG: IS30 family transposase [Lachnospiraceae bacterium]|nr:IS30 family transposase [Lachnospiraceae bacterium]